MACTDFQRMLREVEDFRTYLNKNLKDTAELDKELLGIINDMTVEKDLFSF